MIATKTKQNTDKTPMPSTNGVKESADTCVVASGNVIEGKFFAAENVRLDGLIKGEVKCAQRLVMGASGRIEGNVRTNDAIIMGTIEGEVYAAGTLHLKGEAVIRGIIQAKYMIVDEGARYVGECKIGS